VERVTRGRQEKLGVRARRRFQPRALESPKLQLNLCSIHLRLSAGPIPELSALLMQAIHLAGARRGLSRAERIREATLLEVLSTTMRSAR
jgi:hypothetical protein